MPTSQEPFALGEGTRAQKQILRMWQAIATPTEKNETNKRGRILSMLKNAELKVPKELLSKIF